MGDILHSKNVANLTREKRTIFKLGWKEMWVFFFLLSPFPFNLIFSLVSSPHVAIHVSGVLNATSDKTPGLGFFDLIEGWAHTLMTLK